MGSHSEELRVDPSLRVSDFPEAHHAVEKSLLEIAKDIHTTQRNKTKCSSQSMKYIHSTYLSVSERKLYSLAK
jgi:hypothetical protein